MREDAAFFRRLGCLSLIARHDSVSTVMICSQVARGREVTRKDCPGLRGESWDIDFLGEQICLVGFFWGRFEGFFLARGDLRFVHFVCFFFFINCFYYPII